MSTQNDLCKYRVTFEVDATGPVGGYLGNWSITAFREFVRAHLKGGVPGTIERSIHVVRVKTPKRKEVTNEVSSDT